MGIQFERAWALLLFAPLLLYAWYMWKYTQRLNGARKKIVAGLRLTALIMLVLAMAGAQGVVSQFNRSVIFAVDRSDSVKAESREREWLQGATAAKAAEDEAGVVSIGLDAALETELAARPLDSFQFSAQTNPQFSNIAQGLQLASGLLKAGKGKRIVLLSDGEENAGDMMRQGTLLKNLGIPVDVVPIPAREKRDAALEALRVPEKLSQAEAYTVEMEIRATAAGDALLRVYEDNREIASQSVTVEKGDNRFAVKSLAKEPGFHQYRAEIYMDGDEQSANNTNYAFGKVQGPPKVLVVEAEEGASHNVEAALRSALIPYDKVLPEMLSSDFVSYVGYDSIVLNNVPATRIPQLKMEMIEQAVRDYGIGLVMLGGQDSYGLGGYFQTPVERALPVYMDLRGKKEMPSLGIVLVIDKSGSMYGEKMKLAQEAASRTADLLRDKDTLGVLGFDSNPLWYVEPQRLDDKEGVIRKINSIPADGGTEIYTAVDEAYRKLAQVDAQRKHIILLTDGQSSTNRSYQSLVESMQNDHITMSTVAIGTDADQALLKQLADLAKGRFYAAVNQTTIPAIFSREAVLISRTYAVNQPFVPAYAGGADWSGLFGQGVPPLNGYIATTPKETADVVLSSPEPDPILARWQYGAGRTVAWTSDVTGAWSGDWIKWSGFPQALTGMIKWTFPQFESSPLELTAHLAGGSATLEASGGNSYAQGELHAVVTDDSLANRDVVFTPTAPGDYSAQIPVDKSGVYMVKTELLAPGGDGAEKRVVGSATTGFVVPYSPEYRITEGQGLVKLKQLAALTGGRMLSLEHPEEAFAFASAAQKRLTPISKYLLMAALALLLLDIAARRLNWPSGLRPRTAQAPPAPAAGRAEPPETPLARLRQRQQLAARKLLRPAAAEAKPAADAPARPAAAAPPAPSAAGAPQRPSAPPPPDGTAAAPAPAAEDAPQDAMSRLLGAKRRGQR